jgi:hypothetical protein
MPLSLGGNVESTLPESRVVESRMTLESSVEASGSCDAPHATHTTEMKVQAKLPKETPSGRLRLESSEP